jgi:LmbE family N-acetylglucosaminyl deacetylase
MKLLKLKVPKTKNRVALVSVAHADDVLLFCGGAITTLIKAGWKVTVVRATNDRWDSFNLDESSSIVANTQEFNSAMATLGVSKVIDLNLDTDRLGDFSEVTLRSKYIDLIRDVKPYLVITFDPDSYLYEDNEDHRKVAVSMAEAMWTSGFDKHPGEKPGKIEPFLPVARWYFGREVAMPTHILDVTLQIDELVAATSLHETMLVNMARQLWLKGQTAGISLDKFFTNVSTDVSFFSGMIVKKSRQKKAKSKNFFEIYRVIDDINVLTVLSELEEK